MKAGGGAGRVGTRLVLFNHKGGVGKTTLTVNVADALARLGKRVLLVDSDPQCNLTSHLVEDAVVDSLLDESNTDQGATLWTAVRPVVEGLGDVNPVRIIEARDNLFLAPGDIRLADFESELTQFWSECLQRKPRGFRGFSALSRVVDAAAKEYNADLVFYDSGPNIGPLNRAIVLDCDFFVVPAACDEFSIRALKTLGHTLEDWIRDWETITSLAPANVPLLPGRPRMMGYVPQRFRTWAGRPASQYAQFLPKLERGLRENVVERLRALDASLVTGAPKNLRLGDVKDFGALAGESQREGVPMQSVRYGNAGLMAEAAQQFQELARAILKRVEAESQAGGK